jgi:deoxyribonuclease-4
MKIGAHVSIAGGVYNAPLNAAKIGCECFQMFTRSPQGGKAPVLDEATVEEFKANCQKHKLNNYYVHTPYYINLASSNNRIRHGSISVIRDDLERSSLLGVKALMTHLGSASDVGQTAALQKVIEGLGKVLTGYRGSTQFLMEISAGSGSIIGDSFEEIGAIIQGVPNQVRDKLAVCFDTCHAFVSGYDLRTKAAVEQTLENFDQKIGFEKLVLIHANDAKKDLGSHADRHEHIGLGKIGQVGFQSLLNYPRLKNVDFILETPPDGNANDIKILKDLRA